MPRNIETKREKIIRGLDLPEELILDLPTLNIYGNRKVEIYNFKALIEYTLKKIRISTTIGMVVIEGSCMKIKTMTTEEIHIIGNIAQVSYVI